MACLSAIPGHLVPSSLLLALLAPPRPPRSSSPSSSSSSSSWLLKRHEGQAGCKARLAPSYCDSAPGVPRGWVAGFDLDTSLSTPFNARSLFIGFQGLIVSLTDLNPSLSTHHPALSVVKRRPCEAGFKARLASSLCDSAVGSLPRLGRGPPNDSGHCPRGHLRSPSLRTLRTHARRQELASKKSMESGRRVTGALKKSSFSCPC